MKSGVSINSWEDVNKALKAEQKYLHSEKSDSDFQAMYPYRLRNYPK